MSFHRVIKTTMLIRDKLMYVLNMLYAFNIYKYEYINISPLVTIKHALLLRSGGHALDVPLHYIK